MTTPQDREEKKWFEANFLDGDEIQSGQMLSSEECFETIKMSRTRLPQGVREMIEKENNKQP